MNQREYERIFDSIEVGDTVEVKWTNDNHVEGVVRYKTISEVCFDPESLRILAGSNRNTFSRSCSDNKVFVTIINKTDNQPIKTFMPSILEFAKNLTLSNESKRRVKYGIEAPAGTPTSEGIDLSNYISYQANLAKIDELLEKREQEEEAKK